MNKKQLMYVLKIKKIVLFLLMFIVAEMASAQVFRIDLLRVDAICDKSLSTTMEIVPVVSQTGKTWLDRNLGASRVAHSSTDYRAYGCLYQWGRGNDGHASIQWKTYSAGESINGTTATQLSDNSSNPDDSESSSFVLVSSASPESDWRSPSKKDLWQGVNGVHNPCPTGYRVPTRQEFEAEMSEYGIVNASTAYSSMLKLVLAGYRSDTDGNIVNARTEAHIWTSTVTDSGVSALVINSDESVFVDASRSNGYSVRCMRD